MPESHTCQPREFNPPVGRNRTDNLRRAVCRRGVDRAFSCHATALPNELPRAKLARSVICLPQWVKRKAPGPARGRWGLSWGGVRTGGRQSGGGDFFGLPDGRGGLIFPRASSLTTKARPILVASSRPVLIRFRTAWGVRERRRAASRMGRRVTTSPLRGRRWPDSLRPQARHVAPRV